MHRQYQRFLNWATSFVSAACLFVLMAVLAAGCSSSQKARRIGYGRVVTPIPPAFLTGPASLLLTNNAGLSARAELKAQSSLGTQTTTAGQLLARGAKFLYAPEEGDPAEGTRRPGEYSFIWDAAEHRGYVLSEALQAYAPMNVPLQVTNLQTEVGKSAAQRVAGHPCEPVAVTSQKTDGPTETFDVLRAMDLNGLPLRIESVTNSVPFVLTLSKVRLEAPALALFSPPEGFAKYPSPQAMADELAAREHNLRRKSGPQFEEPLMPEMRRY